MVVCQPIPTGVAPGHRSPIRTGFMLLPQAKYKIGFVMAFFSIFCVYVCLCVYTSMVF